MGLEPNWIDIEKCQLWKVLGVSECNNCDGLAKCWGENTQLSGNIDVSVFEPRKQ